MAQSKPNTNKNKIITLQRALDTIPVLFSAFISASFVWHFTASKTPFIISFAAAFVYQLVLFAVFDEARKPRRKLLFAIYITLIMLITPHLSDLYETVMYSRADSLMAGMDMVDWFFASGSYTEYNPGFCCYLLMTISLPIGAAIYFYTKMYLRISVLFLVSIFPPVIYAKDYESYPTHFCVILMLLLFLTIIYCQYLKPKTEMQTIDSAQNKSIGGSIAFYRSTAVFLAVSAIVAIIVPKPDIDDKRQAFDEFTQGKFSSSIGRLSGEFTQTSSGNNNYAKSNYDIAYVEADEILNLKTKCFYYYDHSKDEWTCLSQDYKLANLSDLRGGMELGKNTQGTIDIPSYSPSKLIEDIIYACNADSNFAQKYNLKALVGENCDLGDYESTLCYYIMQNDFYATYFFAPENAHSINIANCKTELNITKSDSGVLYAHSAEKNYLLCTVPGQAITFEYISPSFIFDDRAQAVLRALSYEDYGEFLYDLYVLTNSDTAYEAFCEYIRQNAIYEEESKRVFSKKIRDLADDITDGLYSDYEKAKAIEQYFTESGFEYNADYICPEGENIKHFLFESRQGSCYHYATAMTLLCRSVGLNARYCEGFSYSEKAQTSYSLTGMPVYLIDEGCSHAFCEVYISGYGWMRFEPTVADSSMSISAAQIAKMTVFIIIATPVTALLFTLFIFPILQRLYLLLLANSGKDKALCRYIIKLLKKSAAFGQSKSALEVAIAAQSLSGTDLSNISACFDACIYGNIRLNRVQMKDMIRTFYEFKKAFARQKRHAKAKGYTHLQNANAS